MSYDATFWDGFDGLGPVGFEAVVNGAESPASTLIGGKWTGLWAPAGTVDSLSITVAASLVGPGQSLSIAYNLPAGSGGLSATLDASYGRIAGSAVLAVPGYAVGAAVGICFGDAGSDQLAITVEPSGQLGLRRASGTGSALAGVLLALSDESISEGEAASVAFDVTPHSSAGVAKVWLNGLPTSLFLTGLNTQNTANATMNQVRLMCRGLVNTGPSVMLVDHFNLRLYSSAGGTDTPPLRPSVETQFPIADDSIDFSVEAAILGADQSGVSTTNAPGANQLFLRQVTPEADGTLETVAILPAASSVTAKFTMAAFADSSGAPGALLSDGVEVIGCTAGEPLLGDLVTPQAITAGTPLWIGAYGDTSIALAETDAGILGRKVANTYGSGAPNPAGAMTASLPSWVIFGLVSGVSDTWSVVNQDPASALSFVASAGVGDRDLLVFPSLSSTPTTIYGLSVEIVVDLSDAGLRTVNLLTKSGSTVDEGSAPGQAPSTTRTTLRSSWGVDPDTLAAWNASGVNLAKHGYEVAS